MSQDANRRRPGQARSSRTAAGRSGEGKAPAERSSSAPQTRTTANPVADNPGIASTRAIAATRRASRAAAARQRQRTTWLLGGASIVAVVVVIIVAIVVSNSQGNSACADKPSYLLNCGTVAPDFSLPQVPGGNKVTLSSFRGHPVLLELFATWCPHCQRSAQYLEQLDAANKKKGLVMLSVLADQRDHNAEGNPKPGLTSPADVLWFVNTFKVKHPVLYDPNVGNQISGVGSIYGLHAFPTIYLIDKQGVIRWARDGEIGPTGGGGYVGVNDIQAQINKLL